MSRASGDLTFCIITPTFRREALLGRFLRQVARQTYRRWRLIVVHDGPNDACEAIVARHRAADPRIQYLQTEARSRDYGNTPRLEGVRHVLSQGPGDYCVFWDDDNLFRRGALEAVARELDKAGRPDLLLVGMRYRGQVIPPPGVPVAALAPGQVDSASMVVAPSLAAQGYEHVIRRNSGGQPRVNDTSDFQVFDDICRLTPPPRIEVASGVVVGLHDGLRWKPYIRSLLGLPPLGLRERYGPRPR